ncbi:MAG: hypothetical protein MUE51_14870, partial [Thermoleophilia bacterium]|nr:hypothetical protein [Thermoleophilia bacterium]
MTTARVADPPVAASPGAPLADLLSLPALAGARVHPPDADLSVPVAAVTLADAGGPEEAGALVLAPGEVPDPLPAGCVALVMRTAPPPGLGVPAVVLRKGAAWGPVVSDLAAALAAGGAWRRAQEARSAFRTPLLAGRGPAGLAGAARDLLGAPVALLDEYLDLLGAAGLGEAHEQELEAAVQRARGHGPASVIGPFMDQELPELVKFPVVDPAGGTTVLVVWIPAPPGPVERAVLEEAGEAMLLERAREEARIETEASLRGDLVEELLAGEQVSRESMIRRARHLGADLSQGAIALIGKLQDPHTEGRLITDPRLVRRFMQQTRAVLDLHWPRSLIDWHDGLLVVLLPPRGEGEGDEGPEDLAHTLARRLLAATKQTVPGLALTLALSRHASDPERLGAAVD